MRHSTFPRFQDLEVHHFTRREPGQTLPRILFLVYPSQPPAWAGTYTAEGLHELFQLRSPQSTHRAWTHDPPSPPRFLPDKTDEEAKKLFLYEIDRAIAFSTGARGDLHAATHDGGALLRA